MDPGRHHVGQLVALGLAWLARQGFTVADAIRASQLLYSFTIGFCIEEQAVAQAGDDRYSLERRAERVGAAAHPLVAEAGPVIFGDPGARFDGLVAVIVGAAGRMRSAAGEVLFRPNGWPDLMARWTRTRS